MIDKTEYNVSKEFMEPINPLDSRFLLWLSDQKKDIMNKGLSNQPYLGDGYYLTPTLYSYVDANTLETTPEEILRFKTGDKLSIKQNGTEKFFSIVNINSLNSQIKITGGLDYTFTSDPIEEATLLLRGLTFPAAFQYDPQLGTGGVGTISDIVYLRREFYVFGDHVTATIDASFTITGGTPGLEITLPWPGYNLGSLGTTTLGVGMMVGETYEPGPCVFGTSSGSDYSAIGVGPLFADIWNGALQFVSGTYTYRLPSNS